MDKNAKAAFAGAGTAIVGWCLPIIQGVPSSVGIVGTAVGLGIIAYPHIPWASSSSVEPLPVNDLRLLKPVEPAAPPPEPTGQKGVPDWPIRELFRHIHPGILKTRDPGQFLSASGEILDKLSTGQIESWGRAIDPSHRRLPLCPIPAAYWLHAGFSPWLLDDGDQGGNILQAQPQGQAATDQTRYAEVQVNRSQVTAIWNSTPKPVERDTQLAVALAYAVTGKWDKGALWESDGEPIAKVGAELKRFEQLACDGSLKT